MAKSSGQVLDFRGLETLESKRSAADMHDREARTSMLPGRLEVQRNFDQ